MVIAKFCKTCQIVKAISLFNKKKNGHQHMCKECQSKYAKNYNLKNKEKVKEKRKIFRKNNIEKIKKQEKENYNKNKKQKKSYNKEWYLKNKEYVSLKSKEIYNEKKDKIKESRKKYYEKNKEIILKKGKEWYEENKPEIKKRRIKTSKEYREKNKPKLLIQEREYRKKNKDKIKEYRKNYVTERKKIDKHFHLTSKIKDLFNKSIKSKYITKKFEFFKYTEIPYSDYTKHLSNSEYWQDFCNGKDIHIDHIIPCLMYDFTDVEEIKKCWHPLNLRLIPASENLSKHSKVDFDLIKQHGIEHLISKSMKINN